MKINENQRRIDEQQRKSVAINSISMKITKKIMKNNETLWKSNKINAKNILICCLSVSKGFDSGVLLAGQKIY